MATSFYATPRLTTVSFALGLLLFLLPFVEIKCNGASVAHLSGVNMVTGSAPKMSGDLENMTQAFGQYDGPQAKLNKTEEKGKAYAAALIALLLGIGGLAVSLTKKKVHNPLEMLLGVAGAVALIVLMIQVKGDVNSQVKSERGSGDGFSDMIKATVDFTFWFFLCVASYLASAFFSYKQKELTAEGDMPPQAAPQLDLRNPGDQSEFPAAPSGEKDLG
jgi:hypothetical protein